MTYTVKSKVLFRRRMHLYLPIFSWLHRMLNNIQLFSEKGEQRRSFHILDKFSHNASLFGKYLDRSCHGLFSSLSLGLKSCYRPFSRFYDELSRLGSGIFRASFPLQVDVLEHNPSCHEMDVLENELEHSPGSLRSSRHSTLGVSFQTDASKKPSELLENGNSDMSHYTLCYKTWQSPLSNLLHEISSYIAYRSSESYINYTIY